MQKRRTSYKLVETALKGALCSGLPVASVEVHSRGVVRIYFTDPNEVGNLKKVTSTCDDIFEARSG